MIKECIMCKQQAEWKITLINSEVDYGLCTKCFKLKDRSKNG
jgi:hypothetical protein